MTLRYNPVVLICSFFLCSHSLFPLTAHPAGTAFGAFSPVRILGEQLPTITSIAPASGTLGQTVVVVCTGMNFIRGVTTVDFGSDVTIHSVTVQNSNRLVARITISDSAEARFVSVSVSNDIPGGGTTLVPDAFALTSPPPILKSISPSTLERGQSVTVIMEGNHLNVKEVTADFGSGVIVQSIREISRNQLKVEITISLEAQTGARTVAIGSSLVGKKKSALSNAITIVNPSPVVSDVRPTLVKKGKEMELVVTGANFLEGVSSALLGPGLEIISARVISSSQMILDVKVSPDARVGTRDVVVANGQPGGGTAKFAGEFIVGNPEPIVESITPLEGKRGQTLELVLKGNDFIPGASELHLGEHILLKSFSVVGPHQITASITITPVAASGVRDVSISNHAPGGGVSTLSKSFTVLNPQPVVLSVTPAKGTRGSTSTIVIAGANFFPDVTSVSFGPDITANSIAFRSGTELSVEVSINAAAQPGPRSITVWNAAPGGGKFTLANAFTINAQSSASGENASGAIPEDFILQEAYPNPFNPSTTIRFGLPEQSHVKLEIHNLIGKVVAELIDGVKAKGYYEIPWVPSNLPSGVYLVRIQAASTDGKRSFVSSRKVVLLK